MLPEGLVFYRYEGIDQILRHVLIFDDLAVLCIEDTVYLLALIVVNGRRCVDYGIDIRVVIARGFVYNDADSYNAAKHEDGSETHKIQNDLLDADLILLIGLRNRLLRIEFRVRLEEKLLPDCLLVDMLQSVFDHFGCSSALEGYALELDTGQTFDDLLTG
jgi:hypothetical protein